MKIPKIDGQPLSWIVLHVQSTLKGTTLQELNPTQRGIWFTFLLLAAQTRTKGVVEMRAGIGYPLSVLACEINATEKEVESAIQQLVEYHKIELLDSTDKVRGYDKLYRFKIVNWPKYQANNDEPKKRGRPPKDKEFDVVRKEQPKQMSEDTSIILTEWMKHKALSGKGKTLKRQSKADVEYAEKFATECDMGDIKSAIANYWKMKKYRDEYPYLPIADTLKEFYTKDLIAKFIDLNAAEWRYSDRKELDEDSPTTIEEAEEMERKHVRSTD